MNKVPLPDDVRRRIEAVLDGDETVSEWLVDAVRLRLNVENADELLEEIR